MFSTTPDKPGEEKFEAWQRDAWRAMPLQQLDRLAGSASILDRGPYFVLAERDFANWGNKLRAAIDDQFRAEFTVLWKDFATRVGENSETYKRVTNLEETLRKDATRSALDVLCRRGEIQDLQRIRAAANEGFVTYSELDIAYLRRLGDWEDIQLIISLVSRPDYSAGLLGFGDNSKQRTAALAAYELGKDRLDELLLLEMPTRMKQLLILLISDRAFRAISETTVDALLLSESDIVRKAVALKCVRAFSARWMRKTLERYIRSDEQRYYNVVHWLDLGASLPRALASQVAVREIERSAA